MRLDEKSIVGNEERERESANRKRGRGVSPATAVEDDEDRKHERQAEDGEADCSGRGIGGPKYNLREPVNVNPWRAGGGVGEKIGPGNAQVMADILAGFNVQPDIGVDDLEAAKRGDGEKEK